ncbi:endonuclease/exonuclease/phosphatase family protein [Williamsia maris]|uniref:Vancomycin resistance protein VanJ n=1 Tax=Williamsia maris TaxID=72806 RepID=A0ABT1HDC2_9NOCA|nr:endonuclease/exonuclease/phosphatase family protein [Williamsia maris]MCP2176179.1 vancomycin resistance protein VanJ [Williamsia maris]
MVGPDEITVGTWNTEWAPGKGIRATMVRERLAAANADVLVVTEGRRDLLPDGGHVADGGDDWGYGQQRDRRKVIAWSRWPLTGIEYITTGGGAGRVISALTAAPTGQIRILAVCIPWSRAHVSTGRRDATAWSEHLDCLDQLEALNAHFDRNVPTVVAGDFNQRVPRGKQPAHVATRLAEVLDPWVVHTAGDVEHGPLIDHIASDLTCTEMRTWPGHSGDHRLSDHSGVVCRLTP